jgi:ComEC/Rec2-related protein
MPDSLSSPLACGDSVCFYAKVSRPFSEKELTGFDYGDYLLRKGISGTALAYAGNWRCTGKPHSLSFMQRAKVCQQKVVDVYQSWGLEEDVRAVVSALTIGEKSELTPELKAVYSAAGASHVLALSGLHVGIFSCILLWLFYPLTYLKHGRKMLALLVVCLLWGFAFISGLSSSVVRAVVMYSLYTLASFCLEERFSGMHSLVLAAFLMLVYNPFFLFDISFQLSFVADFIGESNILNGTMIKDNLVRFCDTDFECVDRGFGEQTPVDVVIRPEDIYIFQQSDAAQLTGVVQSTIFKGVHYEMTVLCGDYEFLVQDYHHFEVGDTVGLLVKPMDIHIMHKERVCNTFEGKLLDAEHVEFLGYTFACMPVSCAQPGEKVSVEVDFNQIILQDNEEDGALTGEVRFILYKGNHYHLTVLSDWDELVYVDTNDVWDDGDRVGITIPAEAIRVVKC